MAAEVVSAVTKEKYKDLQGQMVKMQEKLMRLSSHYNLEVMTAKVAAILQLSVMWKNRWREHSHTYSPYQHARCGCFSGCVRGYLSTLLGPAAQMEL